MSVAVLCAAAPAAVPLSQDSNYEERLIQWGLELHGRELEPSPEGKKLEEVLVASEEVFAPSDPYPGFLNFFHVKTRDQVVRREVLIKPGESWNPHRALETERNLRRLFLLAVVKVVAVKGKEPGGVSMLVVTKDKWSLRLSNSFTLIGSLLQFLQLELIEVNFNGWGQQLALNTTIRLDTFAIGQRFIERRLFSSRWYFGEVAQLIFNRQSGKLEGTSGAVTFGQPIINLDPQWAFLLEGSWNLRTRRIFRGANIWQLPYPDPSSGDTVPYVYSVGEFTGEATLTRSFGRELKVDASVSLGGWSRQYKPTLVEGEKAEWLAANYLPRSENVTYASAYVRAFPSDFRVLRNIDTFELSEDYQLGWVAQGGVRWAFPLPFAPSNFIETGAALRYRFYKADDLFTVTVAAAMRIRPGLEIANRRLAFEVSNYSPQFYGGRFVSRVLVDLKANDLDNRQLLLGGSTGLRGAFPEQFSGRNMVLANFEYRAKPIELFSNWLGLVFFYDVGSVFGDVPSFTHSTGIGLRLLLPQLNRDVLQVNFGVVIGGAIPGPDRINAGWGQVTDLRPAFLDDPLCSSASGDCVQAR
ncbi:MAG: BamA/TamA family outer membrane protein [Archangium sp.]